MKRNADSQANMLGAHYILEDEIGRGAMGQVFRATDKRNHATVAAKILRSEHMEDPALVTRFIQERNILMGLRGPGIVGVLDLVVDGGRLGVVMEYVPGGSLRSALSLSGPLPPSLALNVCGRILDALALAHSVGVVHRDVKPDNVLLASSWTKGGVGDIRLVDFGIASIVTDGARRTSTGIIGTPEYMPPELISEGVSGAPGDVYSTGVVLYELLAGRTPFGSAGNDFTIAHRHVTMAAPEIDVPAPLWKALTSMLNKVPSSRPTAAEAAELLRSLAKEHADLAALERPEDPSTYSPTYHPATIALGVPDASAQVDTPLPDPHAALGAMVPDSGPQRIKHKPIPNLGTPDGHTIVQPLGLPGGENEENEEMEKAPTWWRRLLRPRIFIPLAISVVLVIGLSVYFALFGFPNVQGEEPQPQSESPITANGAAKPTAAGLTMSWSAVKSPNRDTIEVTMTFNADNAPLEGPFFAVLGPLGDEGGCPSLTWNVPAAASRNSAAVSGVNAKCGWALNPGTIGPKSQLTLQATITPEKEVTQETLTSWVEDSVAATETAMADKAVQGTAYPVQRLTGVQIKVPSSVVASSPVQISVVPVWPSGADEAHPIFVSPAGGEPSTLLTSIAGGAEGVVFSDGCAGSLVVSTDGRSVSTVGPTPSCVVKAQVGNFLNLNSNQFAIVNSGS
ncbi:MAG: serine/threonine-protein kinase [Actinomycetaceae bacterium]|nr:serine/threonine-protein kinase [Actinomycetaceae bacterium]